MADMPFTDENEEWRDIPEWDGYQASSFGRIRSLDRVRVQKFINGSMQPVLYRGRIRAQSLCKLTGYYKVGMSNLQSGKRRTVSVHELVCSAFHGAKCGRLSVAHNNGNRRDNRPSNLRWATHRENMADRTLHGTENFGERNGMAKLTRVKVTRMRWLRRNGVSARQLAEMFGLSVGHVHDCVSGRFWRELDGRWR